MVELNEKAIEAAHRAYEDATPSGYRYVPEGIAAALRAYLSALPAPDDGLVERLRNVSNMINMGEGIRWGEETALMDQAATALQSKDEQIERLKNLNADLLTQAKGHAQEARTANGTIYEIYQVLSGGKGEPGNWHGAEPARRYVEAAEQQVQKLTADNERLREIVSECAAALLNGAYINPKASLDFMAKLPAEIRSVCSALETQEGGK